VIHIIWSFRVRAEHEQAFAAAYKHDGAWAQLFRKARGYRGTDLLRDEPGTQRYVTIDKWDSSADFDAFRRDHHDAYMELDREFERFTEIEEKIGVFEVVE
jgi:heme-degrading monooxygenase HmoA